MGGFLELANQEKITVKLLMCENYLRYDVQTYSRVDCQTPKCSRAEQDLCRSDEVFAARMLRTKIEEEKTAHLTQIGMTTQISLKL